MLKILDRYILKKFLGTFFFIVILMAMLAVVVDFAEKIEDFAKPDGPKSSEIIFDYYLNFMPYITSLLFPLYALIAVIYFTSRLAANSEIIAMIGNGINFYRLLYPYMIGAFIISGIHFCANHFVFPVANKSRTKFENTYIWKHNFQGPTDNIHIFSAKNEEIYIQHYSRSDSTAHNFSLMRYDNSGLNRFFTLNAQRVKLIKYPNKWRMFNYNIRYVNGINEKIVKGSQMDTVINLKSADLAIRDNLKDAMSSGELVKYVKEEKSKGSGMVVPFQVEYYRRTADPFSIIVLTIIGLAISSRKMRGGMGWHLVLGMLISALYIFMGKFSMTFSTHAGLPPFIGAWVPNIIFSVVAIYLLLKAQK
jgi:lipopolysaccharide export system permease protein